VIELKDCDVNASMILTAWKTDIPLPPKIDMQHVEKVGSVPNPHPPPKQYDATFFDLKNA